MRGLHSLGLPLKTQLNARTYMCLLVLTLAYMCLHVPTCAYMCLHVPTCAYLYFIGTCLRTAACGYFSVLSFLVLYKWWVWIPARNFSRQPGRLCFTAHFALVLCCPAYTVFLTSLKSSHAAYRSQQVTLSEYTLIRFTLVIFCITMLPNA